MGDAVGTAAGGLGPPEIEQQLGSRRRRGELIQRAAQAPHRHLGRAARQRRATGVAQTLGDHRGPGGRQRDELRGDRVEIVQHLRGRRMERRAPRRGQLGVHGVAENGVGVRSGIVGREDVDAAQLAGHLRRAGGVELGQVAHRLQRMPVAEHGQRARQRGRLRRHAGDPAQDALP